MLISIAMQPKKLNAREIEKEIAEHFVQELGTPRKPKDESDDFDETLQFAEEGEMVHTLLFRDKLRG